MNESRAKYATPNEDPIRRFCAAHGRDKCGEEGIWMLHGSGVTYPACREFVEERQIPIRGGGSTDEA